jgi:hypothetical protein
MSMDDYALYDREEPALDDFERTLYDEVARDEPWELVEEFAELEREPGTEDEQDAARYIEGRFDEYGIPYERYDPEFWIGEPDMDTVSISVTAPVAESFNVDTDRPSVKAQSFSGSGTVSGELVQLDLPEAANVQELRGASLEDLGEADRTFEGKVVLVTQPILSRQLVMELQDRGAVAYLLVHPHPEEPHYGTAMPVWGAVPKPDQTDLVPEMHIMNLSRTVGDRLLELLDGEDPVEVEVSAEVPRRWIESPLVVAKVPGEANPDSDDFVLLHGHVDSYDVGVTDNATGNAGMVEAARLFNEHREEMERDLWVAFWPAHEGGRYGGSTWFAEKFAQELVDDCLAHVNFDSPGVKDATEFEEMTVWMAEADELCRGAIDDVAGKDATENRPRRSGDYSFYNLGVTGLLCLSSSIPQAVRDERGYHPVSGSGGNSEAWHLTTNTLEKADPDVLLRDTRVYVTVLARLLTRDVVPLDQRRAVAQHREQVAAHDEAAGDEFDLSEVREELSHLADAVDDFYADVEAGNVDPDAANEGIRRLSRRLVKLGFTNEDRFDQDLAVRRPPYPTLEPVRRLADRSGDDYRFLHRQLVRARNAAVYELRRARRELDDVVAA